MATTKHLSSFFFLLFTFNIAMSESDLLDTFCTESSGNFTPNSTYHTNLDTLLSTLSNQSSSSNYYNLTIGRATDTVYGSFFCIGDVNRTTCDTCVKTATIEIAKNCTSKREAIIYYFDCMVRYSDKFFLSTLETKPYTSWSATDPIPKSFGQFGQKLAKKMGEVIANSSSLSSSSPPYYIKDVTRFDNLYDLESIVQCTPHLDPKNCSTCLKLAWQEITDCCTDQLWAYIFTPKCFVSFDTTVSYSPPLPPPNHSTSFSIKGTHETCGIAVTVAASVLALLLGLG